MFANSFSLFVSVKAARKKGMKRRGINDYDDKSPDDRRETGNCFNKNFSPSLHPLPLIFSLLAN